MPDDHEIVFEREAEQAPNIIPGDVIVKLKTKKHATFTRRGDDLLMPLSITLKEALVGFKRRVTHLDGVSCLRVFVSAPLPAYFFVVIWEFYHTRNPIIVP